MTVFCKDCKHNDDKSGNVNPHAICMHPTSTNPVTGVIGRPCSLMRDQDGKCGPEGNHFEQRTERPIMQSREPFGTGGHNFGV